MFKTEEHKFICNQQHTTTGTEKCRERKVIQYAPGFPNHVLATVPWAARATTRVETRENFISAVNQRKPKRREGEDIEVIWNK